MAFLIEKHMTIAIGTISITTVDWCWPQKERFQNWRWGWTHRLAHRQQPWSQAAPAPAQFWWGHWRSWSWWRWWRWWEPGALLPSLRQRRDKLPQLPTLDLSSQLHCDDDVDDDDGDVNDGNDDDCQSCHKFLSVIKKERKGSWWLWAEGRCVAIFCCFIALLWRLMSKCSAAGRPGYSFITFFSLHLCHCQFLHLCQFKFSIFVTVNFLQMKLRLRGAPI